MLKLYRRSNVTGTENSKLRSAGINLDSEITAEWCYYVGLAAKLTPSEQQRLSWLLTETYDQAGFSQNSHLEGRSTVLEVGPRLNFETSWGSTARQVCH